MNEILVINPGSTSTKLALFRYEKEVISKTIAHQMKEIKQFKNIISQREFRLKYIFDFLEDENIDIKGLNAVVARGGLLKPIPGGTYEVNDRMIKDLKVGIQGKHASNLGGILARTVAEKAGCNAYIVDPVVVDEMEDMARISGHPQIKRRSILHALNQKAVARKYASDIGKKYEELNLIIAHLGGGISVGLHKKGKIVDVNNALSGDGPFTPNRCGGLPSIDLIELCFSEVYSYENIKKMLIGNGGVMAYLGTNDMIEIENRVNNGDQKATLIYFAMAYQVAREIGSLAPVVNGDIDGVILTGGIAYSDIFVKKIKERVSYLDPVIVYPGQKEMGALAAGVYRVIKGQEKVKEYK